jgi:hypothetical protein
MTKLTLPVGKDEKHNIDVDVSKFGSTKVHVDGNPVSAFNMPGRLKMVKFSIGDKERHEVEVRVHGFLLHRIEVLVDGNFNGQG